MSWDGLRLDIRDGVGHITLARPNRGNAIDLELARALMEAARRCEDDPAVRAVLITGDGPRFCVGGDLRSFTEQGDELPSHLLEMTGYLHAAVSHLARMDAPVVVGVHGAAAGAGLSLVAMADAAVADPDTRFRVGYTAIGLTPDGSSTYFLPRVVGLRRARRLMFMNEALSAEEALEWGLITEVVDDGEDVVARARQVAEYLAAGPTQAFGAVKRLLLATWSSELEAQLERESEAIAAAAGTADAAEGMLAFFEKRDPEFGGS